MLQLVNSDIMNIFKKISNIVLAVNFTILSVVTLPLLIISTKLADVNLLLKLDVNLLLIAIQSYGISLIIFEIVGLIIFKKDYNLFNLISFAIYCVLSFIYIFVMKGVFELIFDYTIGIIFKGLFYLIDVIFPDSFTKIVTDYGELFYQGIKNTLSISLLGTLFGFLIACVLGTLRTIKVNKKDLWIIKAIKYVVSSIIKVYVTVFRGTPMMVQAMIIFYGLVGVFHWDPVTAGLVIVSINTGAYLTEVIKNGIDSVDLGQMEAARSLGFSYPKSMLLIIFPQAIKNSMASIGNEFVINIKDTSVLNVIGCAEMYFILNASAATNYKFMEQMIVGAIIYLILTFTTTKLLNLVEKKLDVPTAELKGSN